EDLEQVRAQERAVDDYEGKDQQGSLPPPQLPQFPYDDEAQQSVDHHGGRNGNAVGGSQGARAAEQRHQQQHADEKCGVDARDVDLSGIFGGSVQDCQPRQEPELDRLAYERIAPVMTAWLAMIVDAVASTIIGYNRTSGTMR